MKNRKQAERTVIGMGQNLRLNCTAHLMQRLLLTAFFILAVSALAVGISQGERYLQAFALALLGLFLYTALCVPAAKRLEHLGPLRLWLLLTILCVAIKVFWIWRVRVPLAGITRSFGDMPMRFRSAQRYTAGGIWPCFPIFSDMPIF